MAQKVATKKKLAKELPPKSMHERLKELKFYHPGDEAGEIFSLTCDLCYRAYGLGMTERAETLFKWAQEDAQASKEWCEQEGMELEDFIRGM